MDTGTTIRNAGSPDGAPTAILPVVPLPPLREALERIERVFGVGQVLADSGRLSVQDYYSGSTCGYRWVHSATGAMHLALAPGDFAAQARVVGSLVVRTGARRVLELGSGQGFNLIQLARLCPQVDFVGLDLCDHHIARCRKMSAGLSNIRWVAGRFETIPADLGRFDVIFGVESLCYARDRDTLATGIARALVPGGMHVVFDAVRAGAIAGMSGDMAKALRLYEATTAVTHGFAEEAAWTGAYARAGFVAQEVTDLTVAVQADVHRLYGYGQRFFASPIWRAATRALPSALRRNAIGALLGPYLLEGPHDPTLRDPQAALRYTRRIAQMPGR